MIDRYLIVGLGNPGRDYKEHRHNFGFQVLNRLAEEQGLSFGRLQHKALLADWRLAGRAVVLAKPQSFMNLSGHVVSRLARFYKIAMENLLVVYDDLDFPLGTLRFRDAGGAGGHKGVLSVTEQLGSQGFPRLRLGIGRPPGNMDPADFVLKPFSPEERDLWDQVLEAAVVGIQTFLVEGIEMAMSRHNGALGGEVER